MTELKIPEVILRERRKKKLTQEELAAELGVSSQAVSNWERGGYPDITLLPRIANYFSITVDELIGNDEVTREEDVKAFLNRYYKTPSSKDGCSRRLELAKQYYQKYPQNYDIMNVLGEAIINTMNQSADDLPLLHEIHGKIMDGCTDEQYRKNSIHRMCYVCKDEELEDRIGRSELDWAEAIAIGELREERYLLNGRYDEYRSQRNSTDLLIFMQYLGRNNMQYYDKGNGYVFDEPARTAGWETHKMRLIEGFGGGTVPEAWCGCYAEACLRSAAAMIGCGSIDEGFAQLERAFGLYERWLAIPAGKRMDVGDGAAFGGATVTKCDEKYNVSIYMEDGRKTWCPYLWLFWQLPSDIERGMATWPWFDRVRDDPRYTAAYARAKKMSEISD
ncbi:MAG: helix-turn-helix transcriptional regulator [Clostridia bacterium]|nr:helix-turn-helix transcriptional regulator [Clostridia bacterium]